MKIKNLFENKITKGEVYIFSKKMKENNKFIKVYFIRDKENILGKKMGYKTAKEAVKNMFMLKDTTFFKKSLIKQNNMVNNYINKHKWIV